MASLYARYVPPKKPIPTTLPNDAPAKPIAPPVATTRADASSTYSRYIPPTASAASKTLPTFTSPAPPSNDINTSTVSTINSSPTSHKRKGPEGGETFTADVPKKSKKPKKYKQIENGLASSDDDDRHKDLLRRREKSLKKAARIAEKEETEPKPTLSILDEPAQLQPLEPLPQPEPVPEAPKLSTFAALPDWLSNPIRVAPNTTADFTDLGLKPETKANLKQKGYPNAFAVQAAVLPLLLPPWEARYSDVCISAATGSGKTLAYVLPLIKDIGLVVPRLRGIVVVPTRELARQVRDVAEACADVFSSVSARRIQIGIALGNQTLQAEQNAIMEEDLIYDPVEYRRRQAVQNEKWENASNMSDDDNEEFILCTNEPPSRLVDHIDRPKPKIDLLICTPGRLVEHINNTPGFTLDYLKWLVLDEADKLLDQSFQQWKEVVMSKLPKDTDKVTKVVCSATMTRDVSQLAGLKLARPKLVVLEGGRSVTDADGDTPMTGEALHIPQNLSEAAVKVENDGDKPLYLLHILKEHILHDSQRANGIEDGNLEMKDASDSDSTDSSSSSSSDSEDSVSSSSTHSLPPKTNDSSTSPPTSSTGTLIFTKSNESAIRLSRLLTIMQPTLLPLLATLTSTILSSQRRKTLAAFKAGALKIIIASDLVARGLDLPGLTHVINYDLPTSLTSYVHRVGRTARAGRQGKAWTLYTPTEGRWFWREIARTEGLVREEKVERVNVKEDVFGEEERDAYETALTKLGEEARGRSGKEKS